MRAALPRATVITCCIVLLGVFTGCREPGARQVGDGCRGQNVSTAILHESACPVRIVSANASLVDSTLTCRLAVRSVTRSPISSIELHCALKDTSGEFPHPVASPFDLLWTGSLAPADTVSPVLSAVVRFSGGASERVNLTTLVAELEPQEVTFEGGREWIRTGPVAQ